MKHTIYFMILFCFASSGIVFANNNSVTLVPVMPPTPYPKAPGVDRIIVTAEMNENNLTVYFPTSVGIATIAIADQLGEIVAIETIDTSINYEMTISTDNLDSGSYTLTIEYDTTLLTGSFTL